MRKGASEGARKLKETVVRTCVVNLCGCETAALTEQQHNTTNIRHKQRNNNCLCQSRRKREDPRRREMDARGMCLVREPAVRLEDGETTDHDG